MGAPWQALHAWLLVEVRIVVHHHIAHKRVLIGAVFLYRYGSGRHAFDAIQAHLDLP